MHIIPLRSDDECITSTNNLQCYKDSGLTTCVMSFFYGNQLRINVTSKRIRSQKPSQGEDDAMLASSSKTILLASFQQNIRAPLIRYPRPRKSQIDKWSIPEATNVGTKSPPAANSDHTATTVDQVPAPGLVGAAIGSTPKKRLIHFIDERTSIITITT